MNLLTDTEQYPNCCKTVQCLMSQESHFINTRKSRHPVFHWQQTTFQNIMLLPTHVFFPRLSFIFASIPMFMFLYTFVFLYTSLSIIFLFPNPHSGSVFMIVQNALYFIFVQHDWLNWCGDTNGLSHLSCCCGCCCGCGYCYSSGQANSSRKKASRLCTQSLANCHAKS